MRQWRVLVGMEVFEELSSDASMDSCRNPQDGTDASGRKHAISVFEELQEGSYISGDEDVMYMGGSHQLVLRYVSR
jgi:hypothetical protein